MKWLYMTWPRAGDRCRNCALGAVAKREKGSSTSVSVAGKRVATTPLQSINGREKGEEEQEGEEDDRWNSSTRSR